MAKTGKCTICGAHRILRKTDVCKRCNSQGTEYENEEIDGKE